MQAEGSESRRGCCNHRAEIDGEPVRCIRHRGHGRYQTARAHRYVRVDREDVHAVLELRVMVNMLIGAMS